MAIERLSGRISHLAASDHWRLTRRLQYTISRFVEFLETHHENEDQAHEGCRACVLINHVELELGRE